MQSTNLRIDGESFFLASDQDVDMLRTQIAGAAASGAGFVDFATARGELVGVLVTAQSSVHITIRQHEDDDAVWEGLPAAVTDPDLYTAA